MLSDMSGVTTVVVSLVALIFATTLAYQQVRMMRRGNESIVVIEMLADRVRDLDYQTSERYVLDQLETDVNVDRELAVSQLSEPARSHVAQVAFLYETIAVMVAYRQVSKSMILSLLHYRISTLWARLEPHVRAERNLTKPGYLQFFENLAVLAQEVPASEHTRRLKLKSFDQ